MREKEENVKPKIERMSLYRSDWMAILAVFISSGAFFVSLYEANIMREQQEIMQSQQKASVWPYLESNLRLDVDNAYSNLNLSITNKGVGPARIKHFTLFIDDEIVRDYNMIGDKLRSASKEESEDVVHSYIPPSGVISTNNSKMILEIKKPHKDKFDLSTLSFNEIKIGYEICYCSIYGDCWTITDSSEEPKEGCEEKIL